MPIFSLFFLCLLPPRLPPFAWVCLPPGSKVLATWSLVAHSPRRDDIFRLHTHLALRLYFPVLTGLAPRWESHGTYGPTRSCFFFPAGFCFVPRSSKVRNLYTLQVPNVAQTLYLNAVWGDTPGLGKSRCAPAVSQAARLVGMSDACSIAVGSCHRDLQAVLGTPAKL